MNSSQRTSSVPISAGIVRTEILRLLEKGYRDRPSVILRGTAEPDVPREMNIDGVLVVVRHCASPLAAWEALTARGQSGLVVTTTLSEADLGASFLAHFPDESIQRPKAWDALKRLLGASVIGYDLLATDHSSAVAEGLLRMLENATEPVTADAVNLILTREVGFTALATSRLNLKDPTDIQTIMSWSLDPTSTTAMSALRNEGGNALAEAFLGWISDMPGSKGPLIAALLRTGRTTELVPLSLATGLLANIAAGQPCPTGVDSWRDDARNALNRLEYRWGDVGEIDYGALRSLGDDATNVVTSTLKDTTLSAVSSRARTALDTFDELVTNAREPHLLAGSRVSPIGLKRLAEYTVGQLLTDHDDNATRSWSACQQHLLRASENLEPIEGAMRLRAWLRHNETDKVAINQTDVTLEEFAQLHLDELGWVDAAIHASWKGVDEPETSEFLRALLDKALTARRRYDTQFAAVLAHQSAVTHTPGDHSSRTSSNPDAIRPHIYNIEDVITGFVRDAATTIRHANEIDTTQLNAYHKTTQTHSGILLLILDGMDVAAFTSIATDITNRGWEEITPGGTKHRAGAIAVLPTLTTYSRTSLLSGQLIEGTKEHETTAFTDLVSSFTTGNKPGVIFHKNALSAAQGGHSLPNAVRDAIVATRDYPVVSCVLNTIDDELAKGKPIRGRWNMHDIEYLTSILQFAATGGRTIIITADHGHIVERHSKGTRPEHLTSGRSRMPHTNDGEARDGETYVSGARVMTARENGVGSAILAVNDQIRYGPKKEGYHGGGSLAEVVVPVAAFVYGQWQYDYGPKFAPTTRIQPDWWYTGTPKPATGQLFDLDPATIETEANNETSPAAIEWLEPAIPATTLAAPDGPTQQQASLFDTPDDDDTPPTNAEPTPTAAAVKTTPRPSMSKNDNDRDSLGEKIIASDMFASSFEAESMSADQRETLAAFIDALATAPGQRLPIDRVGELIGMPSRRLHAAIAKYRGVLNLDGYPIVSKPDDTSVMLDVDALQEQFEVRS